MQKRTKYKIKIILVPSIIWGLIAYWYYLIVKNEAPQLFTVNIIEGNIPFWFVMLIIIFGYCASVLIGYSLFLENRHWKKI